MDTNFLKNSSVKLFVVYRGCNRYNAQGWANKNLKNHPLKNSYFSALEEEKIKNYEFITDL